MLSLILPVFSFICFINPDSIRPVTLFSASSPNSSADRCQQPTRIMSSHTTFVTHCGDDQSFRNPVRNKGCYMMEEDRTENDSCFR